MYLSYTYAGDAPITRLRCPLVAAVSEVSGRLA